MKNINLLPYYIMLCDALKVTRNIQDDNAWVKYLKSLRQVNLKSNYQGRDIKSINYNDFNILVAYLLTYYPYYIFIPKYILEHLEQEDTFKEKILPLFCCKDNANIALIGGGTSPELIGWRIFLNDKYNHIQQINTIIYDLHLASLREIHSFIDKNFKLTCCTEQVIDKDFRNLNLFEENAFILYADELKNYDAIVIQNCLNEVDTNDEVELAIKNICFVLENMNQNSICIIADIRYNMINRLYHCIDMTKFILYAEEEYKNPRKQEITFDETSIPNDIKKHFFDNQKTKENVKFWYIAVAKKSNN